MKDSSSRFAFLKKASIYIGHFLVLLSLLFLFFRLREDFADIPKIKLTLSSVVGLFIAVLCNALAVVALAWAWRALLGKKILLRPADAFFILGRSQMGKYLPGNIFQYVGRVTIGSFYNVPAGATIFTTGIETALMITCAAALAVSAYIFDNRSVKLVNFQINLPSVAILVVTLCAILLLLAILLRSERIKQWIKTYAGEIELKRLLQASIFYFVLFALFGLSLKALLALVWGLNNTLSWYQLTSGYALAWVLGFVTPGAPVGIGIREAIFFQLYHDRLGDGLTIGLALVARLTATAGDVAAFLCTYLFKREKNTSIRT